MESKIKQEELDKKLTEEETAWFYIAQTRGISLGKALDTVTSEEFQLYMLYFRENPPINEHLNNVGANIAYTVYNCNTTKRSRKLKFKDFKLKNCPITQDDGLQLATTSAKSGLLF